MYKTLLHSTLKLQDREQSRQTHSHTQPLGGLVREYYLKAMGKINYF